MQALNTGRLGNGRHNVNLIGYSTCCSNVVAKFGRPSQQVDCGSTKDSISRTIRARVIFSVILASHKLHPTSSHHHRSTMVSSPAASSEESAAFSATVQITPAGADIAMASAEAEASKSGLNVTICVCDAGGVPIIVKRNAYPASYESAVKKANLAALFQRETGNASIEETESGLRLSVLKRGGVPFILNGVCCGSVGVSGAEPEQDEMIARTAVNALQDIFWSHQVFASEKDLEASSSSSDSPELNGGIGGRLFRRRS